MVIFILIASSKEKVTSFFSHWILLPDGIPSFSKGNIGKAIEFPEIPRAALHHLLFSSSDIATEIMCPHVHAANLLNGSPTQEMKISVDCDIAQTIIILFDVLSKDSRSKGKFHLTYTFFPVILD